MEKIWTHLVNEIRNYCTKNGFKGVTFGLSGGIDSSLVAALSADALGPQNVHCYMLSTVYTSQLSKDLSQSLCSLNNLRYNEIDISPLYNEYKKIIPSPQIPVTYENIQARIRGTIIMAYSNDNNWLALACGNKSELSVGYCTLYGDMCGGLAPIADLYKTEVYKLVQWRNEQSLVIPQGIIDRPPSAELSANQKDEDTLPPYDIMDKILIEYIENNNIDSSAGTTTTEWLINQYHRMSFKRAQAAPSIKARHLL